MAFSRFHEVRKCLRANRLSAGDREFTRRPHDLVSEGACTHKMSWYAHTSHWWWRPAPSRAEWVGLLVFVLLHVEASRAAP